MKRIGIGQGLLSLAAAAWLLGGGVALDVGSVAHAGAQPSAPSPIGRAVEHEAVPMRDGVKLDTSIYLPAGQGPFPTVLVRTPYPMSPPGEGRDGRFMRKLLENGYAIVMQNERGLYLSEGKHTFLTHARDDGYDTIDWIIRQPWSSRKVGTYGCSSTAENQLGLITANHPAHQAAIVLGYGAGIGRIGPYAEQGNALRGGALQLLFATWFSSYIGSNGPGADQRPSFPAGLTREDRTRLAKLYSLAPADFAGDGRKSTAEMLKFYGHLPAANIIKANNGPVTDWEDFARRSPGDAGWAKTQFVNEGDTFGVPAIWGVSWYDISAGPNLFLFDYARNHIAPGRPKDEQFLIVSPGTHCTFQREPGDNPIGDMDVGDASYNYDKRFIDFFDWKLKGIRNEAPHAPHVLTYQMGENRWIAGARLPLEGAKSVDYFLASDGRANSVYGNGRLLLTPATGAEADSFSYNPQNPVPTLGGGACCMGTIPAAGGFVQGAIEARNDVLVFSSPPLDRDIAVRGPVSVELYLSSDAPDTDLTVKLVDVHPDGRAYNLDDTIFRVRYRDGYDKSARMTAGQVYRVAFPPLFTGNTFLRGHRIRIQVSSSNFPRYDRNLNTGGNNFDETEGRIALNTIHHSARYPSRIRLTLMER